MWGIQAADNRWLTPGDPTSLANTDWWLDATPIYPFGTREQAVGMLQGARDMELSIGEATIKREPPEPVSRG